MAAKTTKSKAAKTTKAKKATTAKKLRRSAAKKVISKKGRDPFTFPTDEQERDIRAKRAESKKAKVRKTHVAEDGFHGDYEVAGSRDGQWHQVQIRDLDGHHNTCSCQDFQTNRLGTCKHLERVKQTLIRRRKRAYAAAAKQGSPWVEIFVHPGEQDTASPSFCIRWPSKRRTRLKKTLAPFFLADGRLLGPPAEALPALLRCIEAVPAAQRKQLRLSVDLPIWTERAKHLRRQSERASHFEADLKTGKRREQMLKGVTLYPYQIEGMRHLAFTGRAMLADEMGLGKTVQAIAAATLLRESGEVKRILVVAPASLKGEWHDQIHKFTGRTARILEGLRPKRLAVYAETPAPEILLAGYEQVRRDVEDINRLFQPDLVILDEAQRIKNWNTKTARELKRLKAPYAFVLTGTPLENRIEEVYSIVEFLDPQVFGSLHRFMRRFYHYSEQQLLPVRLDELHARLRPLVLRRRKRDVEKDLPSRVNKTFKVTMTKEQEARYGEFEMRVAKLVAITKNRRLRPKEHQRLMQYLACMRMLCDTPAILDPNCRDCPKLEELDPLLIDLLADPDTKILIFSEWVRMLDLVAELADERGYGYAVHTGKVRIKKRREELRRFREDSDCRLLLLSESGGTGLNLQAANVVINLDLPWNPARLEQRIARAWRKRQARTVTVINFVTLNSIEERMLSKLALKSQLADAAMDGVFPEEGFTKKGSRSAFLERVTELVGEELAGEPQETASTGDRVAGSESDLDPDSPPHSDSPPAKSSPATAEEQMAQLKEDMEARLPNRLSELVQLTLPAPVDESSGKATAESTGEATRKAERADAPTLVAVVQDADDQGLSHLSDLVRSFDPNTRLELVEEKTLDQVRQWIACGWLQASEALLPLLGPPSADAAPPPPLRYPEAAAESLSAAQRATRMAGVLAKSGFEPEAANTLVEARDHYLDALDKWLNGPPASGHPDAITANLPANLAAVGLSELPIDSTDVKTLQQTIAALNRVLDGG